MSWAAASIGDLLEEDVRLPGGERRALIENDKLNKDILCVLLSKPFSGEALIEYFCGLGHADAEVMRLETGAGFDITVSEGISKWALHIWIGAAAGLDQTRIDQLNTVLTAEPDATGIVIPLGHGTEPFTEETRSVPRLRKIDGGELASVLEQTRLGGQLGDYVGALVFGFAQGLRYAYG